MQTLASAHVRSARRRPRPPALGRIARAFAALVRERRQLDELDERILRDIGVTRADVAEALRRPEAHLRSILLRPGDQL